MGETGGGGPGSEVLSLAFSSISAEGGIEAAAAAMGANGKGNTGSKGGGSSSSMMTPSGNGPSRRHESDGREEMSAGAEPEMSPDAQH